MTEDPSAGEKPRPSHRHVEPPVIKPSVIKPPGIRPPVIKPPAKKFDEIATWVREADHDPKFVELARRLRTALPGDPGFGDPLSTTGPGGASAVARVADRILDDQPGAARELGLGALQVWQSILERVGRGRGTSEVTLVFTDLVGFSSWALQAGDGATLALLRKVASAIEPPILNRRGQVVKRMGDGLMAVFPDPEMALRAVVEGRNNLESLEVAGYRPVMRIGLHTGTPRKIGSDWLGVDVNVAARMMENAGDGNIMMSSVVYEAVDPEVFGELELVARPHRRFFGARMSGVPEDLRMYVLKPAPQS